MLQRIHIQNFRSLKDVSLDLKPINLLIGANNSGKSNLLKGLLFYYDLINNFHLLTEQSFKDNCFQREDIIISAHQYKPFKLDFIMQKETGKEYLYSLEIYKGLNYSYSQFIGRSLAHTRDGFIINDLDYILNSFDKFKLQVFNNDFYTIKPFNCPKINKVKSEGIKSFMSYRDNIDSIGINFEDSVPDIDKFLLQNNDVDGFDKQILDSFVNLKIYQPEPSQLKKPIALNTDKFVNSDASNLVAFLDNMDDEFPDVIKAINQDLTTCIPEFKDIRFRKISPSEKQLGLRDKYDKIYWSDELSEGTLYFLALLAIVHQPNPPKLLLLEEPEKGIHPRRIDEVIDLIFKLAYEKEIQVMMTTHSPLVLDKFKDIPEAVFVFDKNEEGATEIRNLEKDILIPKEEAQEKQGIQPIDYTRSMGSNWLMGFFGGVPHNVLK